MPLDLTKAQPLQTAVDEISAKSPVGSALKSADWQEHVEAGLRNSAIFSAQVESVRVLDAMQKKIGAIVSEARDATHGGLAMDRSKFVRDIQAMANAEGLRTQDQAKRGTVVDFGSERRLKLILEQQIGGAQAKAYWQQGQDPDILDAFPALELVRVRSVDAPRDWDKRWEEAAKAVNYEGVAKNGKIALKSSPIWRKLSRFDRPWPPFDFNSGMGVEEVDRETAESLGLLKPGEKVEPTENAWNAEMAASVRGLGPDARERLKTIFGDQVTISAKGEAKWKPSASNVQASVSPAGPAKGSKGTKAGKPSTAMGTPVSDAIGVAAAPFSKRLARVQKVADKVHGDGALPKLVVIESKKKNSLGYYMPKGAPLPVHIGIRKDKARWPEFTFLHETGHFLDNHVLGDSDWGSVAGPDLADWRQAVSNSSPRVFFDERRSQATTKEEWEHWNYLLDPRELWARSYSQFIAEESGDPVLLQQLDDARNYEPGCQWTAAEFAPIREAMKALFQKKGWMQ